MRKRTAPRSRTVGRRRHSGGCRPGWRTGLVDPEPLSTFDPDGS